MTSSEDKIIEALKRADAAGEMETLPQVVMDMARNQSLFLRTYPWLAMLGSLAVAIFVAIQFFKSQHPMEWTLYAAIFVCDVIVMAIIKVWLYLCWVRNSIMREIKRLELRLAITRAQ